MRFNLISFILFIFLLCLSSCKTRQSSIELQKFFAPKEINDLNVVRTFFIKELCGEDVNFKKCFNKIDPEYLLANGIPLSKNIDFEKQKEMYDSISSGTFNKIWTFCKTKYILINEEADNLCINNKDGNYVSYLKELGKTRPGIEKYANQIEASGDVPQFISQYDMKKFKKSFNLSDHNVQLLLAIQYLTTNDQHKRHQDLIIRNNKENRIKNGFN